MVVLSVLVWTVLWADRPSYNSRWLFSESWHPARVNPQNELNKNAKGATQQFLLNLKSSHRNKCYVKGLWKNGLIDISSFVTSLVVSEGLEKAAWETVRTFSMSLFKYTGFFVLFFISVPTLIGECLVVRGDIQLHISAEMKISNQLQSCFWPPDIISLFFSCAEWNIYHSRC